MTRSDMRKQLEPGLNAIFGRDYNAVANEHKALFETHTSNKRYEEDVMQTGLGTAPIKTEGESVAYDSMQETYSARYNHVTVALAFAITEEAVEDNLYINQAKQGTSAIAAAMANTKEIQAANIFNNGFSTFKTGDGVAFFSNSHPTLTGNQDNLLAVDLSESAIEDAIVQISLMTDERGILIGATARSLHIPPALQFTAHKILNSQLSTTLGGSNATNVNDVNAVRDMRVLPNGYHVNHRFTDTDAWFIRTSVNNGAKHFIRAKMKHGMDGDFGTGNLRYKGRERYSFGVSDWRAYLGSSGA